MYTSKHHLPDYLMTLRKSSALQWQAMALNPYTVSLSGITCTVPMLMFCVCTRGKGFPLESRSG